MCILGNQILPTMQLADLLNSRFILVSMVYLSLFLDNILLTVVVPIIPDYLYTLEGNTSSAAEADENGRVGFLLSSKALVQLMLNPVVGSLTRTVGYAQPLLIGSINLLLATLMFAFAESYEVLFLARSIQGVSSACIGVSGMSLVASQYSEEEERSKVMGFVLGSIALGVLLGYPLGSILYDLSGKEAPLLVVSSFIIVLICTLWSRCDRIQLYLPLPADYAVAAQLTMRPKIAPFSVSAQQLLSRKGSAYLNITVQQSSLYIQFTGPIPREWPLECHCMRRKQGSTSGSCQKKVIFVHAYAGKNIFSECKGKILIVSGAIWSSTSAMAILEPCLPLWLITHVKPKKWQLGTVFIPDSIGYLVGTNFFGLTAYRWGRYRTAICALILVGISSILIPTATTMLQLVIPHLGMGLGIGIADAALVPLLATLVDQEDGYGPVYSLQQVAVSFAYFLGPIIGSEMVRAIGFTWVMWIVGGVNIAYCPLLAHSAGVEKQPLAQKQQKDYHAVNKPREKYERFYDSDASP